MSALAASGPVLFDTNILIDHLNGMAQAARELGRSEDGAISVITWMEVMAGAADADEEVVLRRFLANFRSLPLTSAVAERAAGLRRELRVKLPDAIILATAEVSGRVLVTRNVRDFPGGMRGVRVPYRVCEHAG